jgi:hypothetical protein
MRRDDLYLLDTLEAADHIRDFRAGIDSEFHRETVGTSVATPRISGLLSVTPNEPTRYTASLSATSR